MDKFLTVNWTAMEINYLKLSDNNINGPIHVTASKDIEKILPFSEQKTQPISSMAK